MLMRHFLIVLIGLGILHALSAQTVRFQVLQFNDIYETGPLSGGKEGGPARVAQYRKDLISKNPNSPLLTILAGDFLSPSVMNDVLYEGKKIKGRQMVELLNSMEVDLVTFGNHEFDLKEPELLARIEETRFSWISGNVFHKTPQGLKPFGKTTNGVVQPFAPCTTWTVQNAKRQQVKVGIIGVTLSGFKPAYAEITSFTEAGKKYADSLLTQAGCHLVMGITHLNIEEDRELARAVPALKLIMGGHEHEAHTEIVGNTRITKADANVRSVYVHSFRVKLSDKSDPSVRVKSRLVHITDKMKEAAEVVAVDQKWKQIAFDSFRAAGFNPEKPVITAKEPLEGLEASVRNKSTNLGRYIASAYQAACPGAKAGILNSGSIRIDDNISGVITEYDILRVLPFGGKVVQVEMTGSLLSRFLQDGDNNQGSGGFLQYAGVQKVNGEWMIQGEKIISENWYPVAISDFLLTGQEKNMDYLKAGNPQMRNIIIPDGQDNPARDVRIAVIDYLRKSYP